MRGVDSIRAVTFDVGGTLIEPWPSVGHVYAMVAEEFGIAGLAPEALNRQFSWVWQQRAGFDYSLDAWRAVVDETFARSSARPLPEACFTALYQRFAHAPSWRVFADAQPALARLRSEGIKLGIISNWDERLRPLLDELQLSSWFEAIVVSREVGQQKPAAAIFRHAADLLDVNAEAVLHVGDSHREDVAGARAAGMQAVFLDRRGASMGGESTVATLADVPFGQERPLRDPQER